MKCEILIPDSGPLGTRKRGEVHEIADGEAHRLIAAGRVKPAEAPKEPETIDQAKAAVDRKKLEAKRAKATETAAAKKAAKAAETADAAPAAESTDA